MKTTVSTTEQLAKIITSTDGKVLSEKLNNYCLDHLECLQELTEELSQGVLNTFFDYYLIYDNNLELLNDLFDTPAETIKAVGSDYSVNDEYAFINNGTGSLSSCSSLDTFYSNEDVKNLATAAIKELKKDTEEETKESIKDLIGWEGFTKATPETLLKALEN